MRGGRVDSVCGSVFRASARSASTIITVGGGRAVIGIDIVDIDVDLDCCCWYRHDEQCATVIRRGFELVHASNWLCWCWLCSCIIRF